MINFALGALAMLFLVTTFPSLGPVMRSKVEEGAKAAVKQVKAIFGTKTDDSGKTG